MKPFGAFKRLNYAHFDSHIRQQSPAVVGCRLYWSLSRSSCGRKDPSTWAASEARCVSTNFCMHSVCRLIAAARAKCSLEKQRASRRSIKHMSSCLDSLLLAPCSPCSGAGAPDVSSVKRLYFAAFVWLSQPRNADVRLCQLTRISR